MFKSVFSKYFTITASMLLVAIIALGGVQTVFFNNYWIEDKRIQLVENTQRIAQHTAEVTMKSPTEDNTYRILTSSIQPTVALLAETLDATVLIVNMNGDVIISSDEGETAKQHVSTELIQTFGTEYFSVSTMGNLFSSAQYAAATPVLMPGDVCIGYVITAMPADDMFVYLRDTVQTYLMSALLVLIVFTVIIYVMCYRLVRPLREMAIATRRFAEGDFSYRVKVRGKDEIAELGAALNNMAVELSATENMSRSFIANVSHELKTPMTTISGFIDGILDGTIPPDKHPHYLSIVSDEVRRLSRVVRSMLELSRIDNGTLALKPVPFDLTEAACGVLLSFEQRIEEKHVEIEGLSACERTIVMGDYDLIAQVLYNLLDNAVKFVNENGTISVAIRRADGRVYCAVRNSGAGLAHEELPRVFERFYKTDRSRSLDKSGVGLGLYIVKTVINLHKGEIHVRSLQGEYCEFEFWLPDNSEAELKDKSNSR